MNHIIQIALAVAICIWAIYRTVKAIFFKKDEGCGCGCSGCPKSKECSSCNNDC